MTQVVKAPTPTFSQVAILFLTTSFTGKDALTTTLAEGNGLSPANVYTSAGLFNTFGVPLLDLIPGPTANNENLVETFYSFPLNSSLQVVAGPKFFWSRYFDNNFNRNPNIYIGTVRTQFTF
ncbi:MAG: hypothetical protein NVS2B14_11370 [Chamaesiphon sp.]